MAQWNTLCFSQAEEAINAERRMQNGQADEAWGVEHGAWSKELGAWGGGHGADEK
jgi:hypothetical protein